MAKQRTMHNQVAGSGFGKLFSLRIFLAPPVIFVLLLKFVVLFCFGFFFFPDLKLAI